MEPELERIQRWMQAVVTHPGGIRPGVASSEASGNLGVDFEQIESIIPPSLTLSGAERLAIYSRSYHARLTQCFQAIFPALLHALGEQLFDSFVIDYLQKHPPHRYTLGDVADDFPKHLAETRPDADQPPENRESWPDFIIELAQLELAFLKVYDGPGLEEQPPLDVLAMPFEPFLAQRIVPAPCFRLFAFRYPVHTYWLSVRRGDSPELPEPAECFVAMTRQDYRVRLYELKPLQYKLLGLLDGRHSLAQAMAQTPDADIAAVRVWLSEWAAKRFF